MYSHVIYHAKGCKRQKKCDIRHPEMCHCFDKYKCKQDDKCRFLEFPGIMRIDERNRSVKNSRPKIFFNLDDLKKSLNYECRIGQN